MPHWCPDCGENCECDGGEEHGSDCNRTCRCGVEDEMRGKRENDTWEDEYYEYWDDDDNPDFI